MITFTGDLYLGANDISIHEKIIDSLTSSKHIVSNFENVLFDSQSKLREDKESILSFEKSDFEKYISHFEKSIILTLGNNHMHDLGADGIESTLSFLDTYKNVLSVGVGTIEEVLKPLVIIENGKKIALLAISTDEPEVMSVLAEKNHLGVLNMNDCKVAEIIKTYKNKVDYFVVLPHWGREYVKLPSVQQRKLAYTWIEAGADLVIGHHAHIVQGKEQYKDKWIYYSLGNYIFPEFYYKNGIKHCWGKINSESISINVDFGDYLMIKDNGLFFDVSNNTLKGSKITLRNFREKSSYLNLENYSLKKYYGIWQKEIFIFLRSEYSLNKKIKNYFPKNKNHGRLVFFVKRLLNKFNKNTKK